MNLFSPAKGGPDRLRVLLLGLILVGFTVPIFGQAHQRLEREPFYRSYEKHTVDPNDRIAHAPVTLDAMMREAFFYRGREEALQPLVDVLNTYLDSLNWSAAIDLSDMPVKGQPYLFVGSSEAETAPDGAELLRVESEKYPPMMIYADKPSRDWRRALSAELASADVDYVLLVWIGFTEYPKADRGFFGKKVVLGTDHEHQIRFLSAEDEPVGVLQISGMLFDRDGKLLRAGAEGIIHEDTPFWAQSFGIEKTIDDRAVQQLLRNERRQDLAGRPLAWKVAAYHLMEQLMQRPRAY